MHKLATPGLRKVSRFSSIKTVAYVSRRRPRLGGNGLVPCAAERIQNQAPSANLGLDQKRGAGHFCSFRTGTEVESARKQGKKKVPQANQSAKYRGINSLGRKGRLRWSFRTRRNNRPLLYYRPVMRERTRLLSCLRDVLPRLSPKGPSSPNRWTDGFDSS
jgi:hypothetical protein